MPKNKVYISSTFLDLEEVRQKVIDRFQGAYNELREHNELSNIMEFMIGHGHSTDTTPLETCLKEVSESNIYILILHKSYGSLVENSNLSYTHKEFNKAVEVRKTKPLQIYRIIPSEAYFKHAIENGLKEKNTLDSYTKFLKDVKKEECFIYGKDKNNFDDVDTEIYDHIINSLVDFYFIKKRNLKVKYSLNDKIRLNRTTAISNFNAFLNKKRNIEERVNVLPMIIYYNRKDRHKLFTSRLKIENKHQAFLTNFLKLEPEFDLISNDIEKRNLHKNLYNQSITAIYGEKSNLNAFFSELKEELETEYKKVYSYLESQFVYDHILDKNTHWLSGMISYACILIEKLNNSSYKGTIYLPMYIEINDKDKNFNYLDANKEIEKYIPEKHKKSFLFLGRLSKIQFEDLSSWINNFPDEIHEDKKNEAINILKKYIFKNDTFPTSLDLCLKRLDIN